MCLEDKPVIDHLLEIKSKNFNYFKMRRKQFYVIIVIIILIELFFPVNVITEVAIDISDSSRKTAEVFYLIEEENIGSVRIYNEKNGINKSPSSIKLKDMKTIRIDPTEDCAEIKFYSAKFRYLLWTVYEITAKDLVEDFITMKDISSIELRDEYAVITSVGTDPILVMKDDAYQIAYKELRKNLFKIEFLTKILVGVFGTISLLGLTIFLEYILKKKSRIVKSILFIITVIYVEKLLPTNIVSGVTVDIIDPVQKTTEIFYCIEHLEDRDRIKSVRIYNQKDKTSKCKTNIYLPDLNVIRIDPTEDCAEVKFRTMKWYYLFLKVYEITAEDLVNDFAPITDISEIKLIDDQAVITSSGSDPILVMSDIVYREEYQKIENGVRKAEILMRALIVLVGAALFAKVDYMCIYIKRFCIYLLNTIKDKRYLNRIFQKLSVIDEVLFKIYYVYGKRRWEGLFLVVLLGSIVILFNQYLIGNRVFLFPTLNSDAYTQFYPLHCIRNEHFHNTGNIIGYSFMSGLGGEISTLNPFQIIYAIFDKELIPYLLWVVQGLKVFLAGLFFMLFLYEQRIAPLACCIGGLCYGFCAQVIVGGLWLMQAEGAIILAMLLYSVERIIRRKKIGCLLVSLSLLYLVFSSSMQIIVITIVFLYIVMRVTIKASENWKEIVHYPFIKWVFLISVIMSFAFLFMVWKEFSFLLQNEQIVKNLKNINKVPKIFSKENFKLIEISFMRTIWHTILGVVGDTEYFGMVDYLGDGTFYCGIISLLLYPQIHVGKRKIEKFVWMCWSFIIFLLTCVPKFRFLLQGFARYNYKDVRLMGTLLILYPGIVVLNNIVSKKNLFSKKLFLATGAVILVLYNVVGIKHYLMGHKLSFVNFLIVDIVILSYIFLIYYLVESIYLEEFRKVFTISCCIVGVMLIEIMGLDYGFINNSNSLDKNEFSESYINDGTSDIMTNVYLQDPNNFFRINKSYFRWYSDAGAQGYNGTMYYSGTLTSETEDFINLVYQLGLPLHANFPGTFAGTYGYPYVSAIMSCKYGLTRDNNCIDYGYLYDWNEEGIQVYENKYFLPMGFIYHKAVKRSEFERLTISEKMSIILAGAILEDEDFETLNMEVPTENRYHRNLRSIYTKQYSNVEFGTEIRIPSSKIENTIEIYINGETGLEQGMKVFWRRKKEKYCEENSRLVSCYENGGGEALLTLSNLEDIEYIRINSFPQDKSEKVIPNVRLSVYNSDEYYRDYTENIRELRKNYLQLDIYSDEYIKGTIDVDYDGICYFPILNRAPFIYVVDGIKVEPFKVNYGFSGVYLEAGQHTVEVIYTSTSPFYKPLKTFADFIKFNNDGKVNMSE